jgi:FkbM family methyltransferase
LQIWRKIISNYLTHCLIKEKNENNAAPPRRNPLTFRNTIKKIVARLGLNIVQTNNFVKYAPARRVRLMSLLDINLLFDVGANIGQYGAEMRELGYKGRIVSFEPLSSAYSNLEKISKHDPSWDILNIGLGDNSCQMDINIAGNSYSSSLLDMKSAHVKAEPQSQYIGKEKITIDTLDAILPNYFNEGDRFFLKLDTQGYEKHVIDGATKSFDKIMCIQMEMSLVPLYETELLMVDMIQWMEEKGFHLWALETEFAHPQTGQLLQVSGTFVRKELIEKL